MPGHAATKGSMHTCPMYSGKSPHVGGPVQGPGVSTVLIKGKFAAVTGDICVCTGGSPDFIAVGEAKVLIAGRPAATVGSATAHGGVISVGEPTVVLGTGPGGKTAVSPLHEIPFPKIKLINRILGNNKEAIAKQEALRAASEEEHGYLEGFSFSM